MSVKSTLINFDYGKDFTEGKDVTEEKEHKVTDQKYWECVSDVLNYYWSEGSIHYVSEVAVHDLGVYLLEIDNRNIEWVELDIQLDQRSKPPEWFKKKIFNTFNETYTESIVWNTDEYLGEEDICNERNRLNSNI